MLNKHKTLYHSSNWMREGNSSVYNTTLHIFPYDMIYVYWSCILNCFLLSSLSCLYAFCRSAIPSSCYIFNVFHLAFVCACVANAQECKKYVIQCMGILILTISGCSYPYNIRTWIAIHITGFYGTKWLWVSRLHNEYTGCEYVNTTIHVEHCHSDHKSSCCVPR